METTIKDLRSIMAGSIPSNASSSNATTTSFEIRSSPGRGLGVFATRDIAAGALILTEKSLLTFDASKQADKAYRDLCVAFARLPDSDKAIVTALHCPMDTVTSRKMIKKLQHNLESAHRIKTIEEASNSSAKHQRNNLQSDAPSTSTTQQNLGASTSTSASSTTPTLPTQAELELYIRASSNGVTYLGPGGGGTETGVFPTAARINHSCEPNVVFAVNHQGLYHLRARQHIDQGEELLVSYVPGFLSTAARKREMEENHRFVCNCPRCGGGIGSGSGSGNSPGAAAGFVSAEQVRTFGLGQHQRAAKAGVDLDELQRRILDLKGREMQMSGGGDRIIVAALQTAGLFGVLYSIAEAHCCLGLVLRSPADVDAAIAYHEKAAALAARYWGMDDVFVHEQRVCVMDLRVQRRMFV